MRILIVHLLSVVGIWCCKKAVNSSVYGHINYEVCIPSDQPLMVYQDYHQRDSSAALMIISMVITGLAVWSVLTITFDNTIIGG